MFNFQSRLPEQEYKVVDLCRLLINYGDSKSDPLLETGQYTNAFRGTSSLFRFLQLQTYPSYDVLPMETRFQFLDTINYGQSDSARELIMLALGVTTFTIETLTCKDSSGRTLLHHIAEWYFIIIYYAVRSELCLNLYHTLGRTPHDPLKPTCRFCRWRMLLREVIAAGSQLHLVDEDERTPLCTLLVSYFTTQEFLRDGKKYSTVMIDFLRPLLCTWLSDLHASGVDLQHYGEQETHQGLKDQLD